MTDAILKQEICIIGAGPAGATTSLFLSKLKVKHMIVDACMFPRDKICGDALDLKVMRVFNHLDPTLVDREILANDQFVKSWGAKIISGNGKTNDVLIKDRSLSYPFFFVAKRGYFDNFLAEKIPSDYADFKQVTKVNNIKRENGIWHISTISNGLPLTIHAKFIVGADGDHSSVLRSLGKRKIDRHHYAGALRQYWKGISDFTSDNMMEIYLPKSLPLAYLWIFPLPNGEANVGCGLASNVLSKKSIDLKKLFHQLITEDPAIAHRFKNAVPLEKPVGWGLPLASERRKASGEGYLLVGDAAGLVCPTTGEGVGPGMMSGYIAAQFIKRALEKGSFGKEMFTNYDHEVIKRLDGDIWKYNLIRKLSPLIYNNLIRLLSKIKISDNYVNKNIKHWTQTAREKKIEIEF